MGKPRRRSGGMMRHLRFGVPSIDTLISPSAESFSGILPHVNPVESPLVEPWVMCILGPDGMGKSILGLHAASTFWMDAHSQASTPGAFPAIIYISTDLKFSQANRTWESFGLDLPAQRDSELRAKVAPRS